MTWQSQYLLLSQHSRLAARFHNCRGNYRPRQCSPKCCLSDKSRSPPLSAILAEFDFVACFVKAQQVRSHISDVYHVIAVLGLVLSKYGKVCNRQLLRFSAIARFLWPTFCSRTIIHFILRLSSSRFFVSLRCRRIVRFAIVVFWTGVCIRLVITVFTRPVSSFSLLSAWLISLTWFFRGFTHTFRQFGTRILILSVRSMLARAYSPFRQ